MNSQSIQNEIEVQIRDDGRVALILLPGHLDPQSVDCGLITQYVRKSGVQITGEVEKRIEAIVEKFLADPGPTEAILAEATPAENGIDGRIDWVEGFDPKHNDTVNPTDVMEEDRVDHHHRSNFLQVEKGTHVATLVQETLGQDGVDVTGKTIKAVPGKKCDLDIESSLRVDGSGCVITEVGGVLQLSQRTIKVTRVLEVEEYVDFSTGNITFEGSVVVHEGVRDCFEIKASEDVTINGLIEAATILCGRNFLCPRGMAARNNGKLIVDGNAEIGYLNDVRGRIKGDLIVRNEVMNCEFAVGGKLDCERASIIGGSLAVTGSVKVQELGSDSGQETTLILGVAPLMSSKLLKLQQHTGKTKIELDALQIRLEQLQEQGSLINPQQQEKMTELSFEISQYAQMLEACELKEQEIRYNLATARQLDLQVGKVVNYKVILKINDHTVVFEEPLKGPVKIFWNERRKILFRQGDGPVRPIGEVAREYRNAA